MSEIKFGYYEDSPPIDVDDLKIHVGSGWSKIIEKLVSKLFSLGWDGRVTDIKEKFGGLRFYIGNGADEMWEVLDEAELESLKTCEICGKPGLPSAWGFWWIKTLCPTHGIEHYEEQRKRNVKK